MSLQEKQLAVLEQILQKTPDELIAYLEQLNHHFNCQLNKTIDYKELGAFHTWQSLAIFMTGSYLIGVALASAAFYQLHLALGFCLLTLPIAMGIALLGAYLYGKYDEYALKSELKNNMHEFFANHQPKNQQPLVLFDMVR